MTVRRVSAGVGEHARGGAHRFVRPLWSEALAAVKNFASALDQDHDQTGFVPFHVIEGFNARLIDNAADVVEAGMQFGNSCLDIDLFTVAEASLGLSSDTLPCEVAPGRSIEYSFAPASVYLPPPTPRSLTKEEQQRPRSHREANKGSYGQAMPERDRFVTRFDMLHDPQDAGQGTCEGDDRPQPVDYGGPGVICRIIDCGRLATTRDQRC